MKLLLRLRSTGIVVVVICALMTAPAVYAQQGKGEDPGPGKGGTIGEPNFGSDITTLNPIIIQDGLSGTVAGNLFPAFIGGDPDTGLPKHGALGSLAKSWKVSDDGLTYTFTLRNDWKWSDGTPITSADVKYAYDAVASGKVDSNITAFVDNIKSLEAPDPQTVVITTKALDCAAVLTFENLYVVPSATYKKVYPTFDDMKIDNPYNLKPTVSAVPFQFSSFRPVVQVTLEAD